jgi:polyisoprenoid-binding protein YceI
MAAAASVRPVGGGAGRRALLACAAALAGPAHAAEHYTFDPAHCIPEFEFTHLGVTTQTGRFDKAHGVVVIDSNARRGSVHFEIQSASLNMGVGTEAPDSLGFRLLQVTRFPRITFRSQQLIFNGHDEVVAAVGTLTLLGVRRPLTVHVNHFQCGPNPMNHRLTCAGDVTASITRSQFGMLQYLPGISDEVKVRVPVEAYRD